MNVAEEAESFALPQQAYLPGKTGRPEEDAYDWIRDRTPERVDETTLDETVSWHYGLRLLREGFYWEAHEVLEPIWTACAPNSRERYMVQGIIQIANAALQAELEKPRAASRLVEIAVGLLSRTGTDRIGHFSPAALRSRLETLDGEDIASGQSIAMTVFK